jgi:hypothetical protein
MPKGPVKGTRRGKYTEANAKRSAVPHALRSEIEALAKTLASESPLSSEVARNGAARSCARCMVLAKQLEEIAEGGPLGADDAKALATYERMAALNRDALRLTGAKASERDDDDEL